MRPPSQSTPPASRGPCHLKTPPTAVPAKKTAAPRLPALTANLPVAQTATTPISTSAVSKAVQATVPAAAGAKATT